MPINLEKFYEKNNPTLTQEEFLQNLEQKDADFLDDLYKKYIYTTINLNKYRLNYQI